MQVWIRVRVWGFERYKAGIAVGSLFRCLFLEERLLSLSM